MSYYVERMPGPEAYNIKSSFDKSSPEGKAFTFGISRDAYARVNLVSLLSIVQVYLKHHPAKDRSIPGPGAYDEGPKLGEKAKKISMLGRTPNPCKFELYTLIF